MRPSGGHRIKSILTAWQTNSIGMHLDGSLATPAGVTVIERRRDACVSRTCHATGLKGLRPEGRT